MTINDKSSFTYYASRNPASGLLQIGHILEKWTDVTIFRHDIIVKIFWRCFVSLIKFSYCSKFHVNMIAGSGVMTISFSKRLTRHRKIGNTPVWVLPDIWRLEYQIPNFARKPLIKCYWMLENARITASTVSGLLRENQQRAEGGDSPPTQIRVKTLCV